MKFGLQVYTVRDDIQADVKRAFQAVRSAGYEYVELYDMLGKTPEAMLDMLKGIGLTASSIMFPVGGLLDNPKSVIATCKAMHCRFAVCPYLDESYRSVEGYTALAANLDKTAEMLSAEGITLAYHNHAFEFDKLPNGGCGYDILFNTTKTLCFEPDVYWFAFGGKNPLDMMNQLQGRMPLLHLKDMSADKDRSFCEVGQGILPMKDIIALAKRARVEFAFVEQDANWATSPIESVTTSIKAIRTSLDA